MDKWTKTTTECIKSHCICGKCKMTDIVYNCQAKRSVLELVRKYGTPAEYEEPTILIEEE